MYNILQLKAKQLPELQEIAKEMNIKKASNLDFDTLVYAILDQQAVDKALKPVEQAAKPKRARIKPKPNKNQKQNITILPKTAKTNPPNAPPQSNRQNRTKNPLFRPRQRRRYSTT